MSGRRAVTIGMTVLAAACAAHFPAPSNWDPEHSALVVQLPRDSAAARGAVLAAFAAESLVIQRVDSVTGELVSARRNSESYFHHGGQVFYRALILPGTAGWQVRLTGAYSIPNFREGLREDVPITPQDLPEWHRLTRLAERAAGP